MREDVREFPCCNPAGPNPASTDNRENRHATVATFALPIQILLRFRKSRNRCRSGNARPEFFAFRIGPHASRREKALSRQAGRVARTAESCVRRAGSGTRGDRIGAARAEAAVVAEASKKYRTAETGCAERTSMPKVFRRRPARAMLP